MSLRARAAVSRIFTRSCTFSSSSLGVHAAFGFRSNRELTCSVTGNFSFYKTFITVPFEKKDPKAIEVIQVVLESILLRREKKMKDKNGKPIVSLPDKHIDIRYLQFAKEERDIYDAIYKHAKSRFLAYEGEGTVLQ